MDLKEIAKALGLPETATEEEVKKAVGKQEKQHRRSKRWKEREKEAQVKELMPCGGCG